MARRRGSFLGKLLGIAAVAGAAATVSKLEKQAKEEEKDILDVAKEKYDGFVKSLFIENKSFLDNYDKDIFTSEVLEDIYDIHTKILEIDGNKIIWGSNAFKGE